MQLKEKSLEETQKVNWSLVMLPLNSSRLFVKVPKRFLTSMIFSIPIRVIKELVARKNLGENKLIKKNW